MLQLSMVMLLILGVESLGSYDRSSRWWRPSVGCTRKWYACLGRSRGSFGLWKDGLRVLGDDGRWICMEVEGLGTF